MSPLPQTGFILISSALFPTVLQGYGAVEDEAVGSRVEVGREVAYALELEFGSGLGVLSCERFYLYAFDYLQGVGIKHVAEVAVGFGGGISTLKDGRTDVQ